MPGSPGQPRVGCVLRSCQGHIECGIPVCSARQPGTPIADQQEQRWHSNERAAAQDCPFAQWQ
eukprot:8348755-Lingulodinium_polyedra.AAC.1